MRGIQRGKVVRGRLAAALSVALALGSGNLPHKHTQLHNIVDIAWPRAAACGLSRPIHATLLYLIN